MKLSFMTFVCPTWELDRIVRFARSAGYRGVEIRVDAGHKHGISSQSPADARKQARKLFADVGVEVASVATSVNFACPDRARHAENVAAAKANLDLAADLGAPVVRIFAGGGIPKLTPQAAEQVAAAFDDVGEHAKSSGVCPMLECLHDIIVSSDEAMEAISRVKTANFGALWNRPVIDDASFARMGKLIRHFHVHDEVLEPTNADILGLAGKMKTVGYKGFVSLEIIHNKDLEEDLLRSTAQRLNRQIAEGQKA
jgi:sugar phosphate isomerase/epimerase